MLLSEASLDAVRHMVRMHRVAAFDGSHAPRRHNVSALLLLLTSCTGVTIARPTQAFVVYLRAQVAT